MPEHIFAVNGPPNILRRQLLVLNTRLLPQRRMSWRLRRFKALLRSCCKANGCETRADYQASKESPAEIPSRM